MININTNVIVPMVANDEIKTTVAGTLRIFFADEEYNVGHTFYVFMNKLDPSTFHNRIIVRREYIEGVQYIFVSNDIATFGDEIEKWKRNKVVRRHYGNTPYADINT